MSKGRRARVSRPGRERRHHPSNASTPRHQRYWPPNTTEAKETEDGGAAGPATATTSDESSSPEKSRARALGGVQRRYRRRRVSQCLVWKKMLLRYQDSSPDTSAASSGQEAVCGNFRGLSPSTLPPVCEDPPEEQEQASSSVDRFVTSPRACKRRRRSVDRQWVPGGECSSPVDVPDAYATSDEDIALVWEDTSDDLDDSDDEFNTRSETSRCAEGTVCPRIQKEDSDDEYMTPGEEELRNEGVFRENRGRVVGQKTDALLVHPHLPDTQPAPQQVNAKLQKKDKQMIKTKIANAQVAAVLMVNKEAADKQAELNRETEKQDADKQDAGKQDAGKQDPSKQDSSKQDADKQEADKQEADKQKADKQKTDKQEPDKQEPDKQEPDKQEPDKQEPDKQEPDKQEADKKNADKQESNKHETDKQGSDMQNADKQKSDNKNFANKHAAERKLANKQVSHKIEIDNNDVDDNYTKKSAADKHTVDKNNIDKPAGIPVFEEIKSDTLVADDLVDNTMTENTVSKEKCEIYSIGLKIEESETIIDDSDQDINDIFLEKGDSWMTEESKDTIEENVQKQKSGKMENSTKKELENKNTSLDSDEKCHPNIFTEVSKTHYENKDEPKNYNNGLDVHKRLPKDREQCGNDRTIRPSSPDEKDTKIEDRDRSRETKQPVRDRSNTNEEGNHSHQDPNSERISRRTFPRTKSNRIRNTPMASMGRPPGMPLPSRREAALLRGEAFVRREAAFGRRQWARARRAGAPFCRPMPQEAWQAELERRVLHGGQNRQTTHPRSQSPPELRNQREINSQLGTKIGMEMNAPTGNHIEATSTGPHSYRATKTQDQRIQPPQTLQYRRRDASAPLTLSLPSPSCGPITMVCRHSLDFSDPLQTEVAAQGMVPRVIEETREDHNTPPITALLPPREVDTVASLGEAFPPLRNADSSFSTAPERQALRPPGIPLRSSFPPGVAFPRFNADLHQRTYSPSLGRRTGDAAIPFTAAIMPFANQRRDHIIFPPFMDFGSRELDPMPMGGCMRAMSSLGRRGADTAIPFGHSGMHMMLVGSRDFDASFLMRGTTMQRMPPFYTGHIDSRRVRHAPGGRDNSVAGGVSRDRGNEQRLDGAGGEPEIVEIHTNPNCIDRSFDRMHAPNSTERRTYECFNTPDDHVSRDGLMMLKEVTDTNKRTPCNRENKDTVKKVTFSSKQVIKEKEKQKTKPDKKQAKPDKSGPTKKITKSTVKDNKENKKTKKETKPSHKDASTEKKEMSSVGTTTSKSDSNISSSVSAKTLVTDEKPTYASKHTQVTEDKSTSISLPVSPINTRPRIVSSLISELSAESSPDTPPTTPVNAFVHFMSLKNSLCTPLSFPSTPISIPGTPINTPASPQGTHVLEDNFLCNVVNKLCLSATKVCNNVTIPPPKKQTNAIVKPCIAGNKTVCNPDSKAPSPVSKPCSPQRKTKTLPRVQILSPLCNETSSENQNKPVSVIFNKTDTAENKTTISKDQKLTDAGSSSIKSQPRSTNNKQPVLQPKMPKPTNETPKDVKPCIPVPETNKIESVNKSILEIFPPFHKHTIDDKDVVASFTPARNVSTMHSSTTSVPDRGVTEMDIAARDTLSTDVHTNVPTKDGAAMCIPPEGAAARPTALVTLDPTATKDSNYDDTAKSITQKLDGSESRDPSSERHATATDVFPIRVFITPLNKNSHGTIDGTRSAPTTTRSLTSSIPFIRLSGSKNDAQGKETDSSESKRPTTCLARRKSNAGNEGNTKASEKSSKKSSPEKQLSPKRVISTNKQVSSGGRKEITNPINQKKIEMRESGLGKETGMSNNMRSLLFVKCAPIPKIDSNKEAQSERGSDSKTANTVIPQSSSPKRSGSSSPEKHRKMAIPVDKDIPDREKTEQRKDSSGSSDSFYDTSNTITVDLDGNDDTKDGPATPLKPPPKHIGRLYFSRASNTKELSLVKCNTDPSLAVELRRKDNELSTNTKEKESPKLNEQKDVVNSSRSQKNISVNKNETVDRNTSKKGGQGQFQMSRSLKELSKVQKENPKIQSEINKAQKAIQKTIKERLINKKAIIFVAKNQNEIQKCQKDIPKKQQDISTATKNMKEATNTREGCKPEEEGTKKVNQEKNQSETLKVSKDISKDNKDISKKQKENVPPFKSEGGPANVGNEIPKTQKDIQKREKELVKNQKDTPKNKRDSAKVQKEKPIQAVNSKNQKNATKIQENLNSKKEAPINKKESSDSQKEISTKSVSFQKDSASSQRGNTKKENISKLDDRNSSVKSKNENTSHKPVSKVSVKSQKQRSSSIEKEGSVCSDSTSTSHHTANNSARQKMKPKDTKQCTSVGKKGADTSRLAQDGKASPKMEHINNSSTQANCLGSSTQIFSKCESADARLSCLDSERKRVRFSDDYNVNLPMFEGYVDEWVKDVNKRMNTAGRKQKQIEQGATPLRISRSVLGGWDKLMYEKENMQKACVDVKIASPTSQSRPQSKQENTASRVSSRVSILKKRDSTPTVTESDRAISIKKGGKRNKVDSFDKRADTGERSESAVVGSQGTASRSDSLSTQTEISSRSVSAKNESRPARKDIVEQTASSKSPPVADLKAVGAKKSNVQIQTRNLEDSNKKSGPKSCGDDDKNKEELPKRGLSGRKASAKTSNTVKFSATVQYVEEVITKEEVKHDTPIKDQENKKPLDKEIPQVDNSKNRKDSGNKTLSDQPQKRVNNRKRNASVEIADVSTPTTGETPKKEGTKKDIRRKDNTDARTRVEGTENSTNHTNAPVERRVTHPTKVIRGTIRRRRILVQTEKSAQGVGDGLVDHVNKPYKPLRERIKTLPEWKGVVPGGVDPFPGFKYPTNEKGKSPTGIKDVRSRSKAITLKVRPRGLTVTFFGQKIGPRGTSECRRSNYSGSSSSRTSSSRNSSVQRRRSRSPVARCDGAVSFDGAAAKDGKMDDRSNMRNDQFGAGRRRATRMVAEKNEVETEAKVEEEKVIIPRRPEGWEMHQQMAALRSRPRKRYAGEWS